MDAFCGNSLLDGSFVRKLGLNDSLMEALAQLPGTKGNIRILRRRALALSDLQVPSSSLLVLAGGHTEKHRG
jgi:hypothetical protein